MRWIAVAIALCLALAVLGWTLWIEEPSPADEFENEAASSASSPESSKPPRTLIERPPPERIARRDSPEPGLALRIFQPSGKPASELSLEMEIRGASTRPHRVHRFRGRKTDSLGRIRVPVFAQHWPPAPQLLVVGHDSEGFQDVGFASVALPAEAPKSTLELGSVVLADFVAEGVVVNDDGKPVKSAIVEVRQGEKLEPIPYGGGILPRLRKMADFDGRFRIGGIPPEGGPLFLVAHKRFRGQTLRSLPLALQPGAKNVRILVQEPGSLGGYVRLPTGTSRSTLEVLLFDSQGREIRKARLMSGAPGDMTHRFEMKDVNAGFYDVAIRHRSTASILIRVDGVRVLSGRRDEDPRLQQIDLSARLGTLSLKVVDSQDRKPISKREYVLRSFGGELLQKGTTTSTGRLRAFIDVQRAPFILALEGCLSTEIAWPLTSDVLEVHRQ